MGVVLETQALGQEWVWHISDCGVGVAHQCLWSGCGTSVVMLWSGCGMTMIHTEIAGYAEKNANLLVPDEGAEYDQLVEIDLNKVR